MTGEDGKTAAPKPRVKVKFEGMTDCVHRNGLSWEDYDCPCGCVYTLAYVDCSLRGRIKATSCRMLCGDYRKRPLEDK